MRQIYIGGFTINRVGSNSWTLLIIRRVAVILILLYYHDIRVYSITAAVNKMYTVKSR